MTDRASLPDFELPATGTPRFQLSAFASHPLVFYFHPRVVERSTFVVDRQGRIARECRGVKVPGHAKKVLQYVRTAEL